MKEYDYRNTLDLDSLSTMLDDLTPHEATVAIEAITHERESAEKKTLEDYHKWFEAAVLPVLQKYAKEAIALLTVEDDGVAISTTITNEAGFDISESDRQMRSLFLTANHIEIGRQIDTNNVSLTLIFEMS
jgi:hypothetical protein